MRYPASVLIIRWLGPLTAQICTCVTSESEASEEVAGLLHSTQGKTIGSHSIRHYYIIFRSTILNYLSFLWTQLPMTHFLRLALKWNGISFYEHMHELRLQSELIQYHCYIQQRDLLGKALEFKQIMNDDVSAVNLLSQVK
jgi:hypothetical protein